MFKLLLLLWKANLHKKYNHTYSRHVKLLDFAPFRGSYAREFELWDSNLVKTIIKITRAHNLHLKMLDFAPLTICTWKNAYCSRDYFAQTLLYFQQNCQIAGILISTHLMLFHSIKQSSSYFVNWLLPSLFANAKVRHLHLATGKIKYVCEVLITLKDMYQIWLHWSFLNWWRSVVHHCTRENKAYLRN